MSKYSPARASVQVSKTEPGDKATYTAMANIFDSQTTQQPGKLYFKIHVKNCPDATRTKLLIEVAGNGFTSPVWQQLDKINAGFGCGK